MAIPFDQIPARAVAAIAAIKDEHAACTAAMAALLATAAPDQYLGGQMADHAARLALIEGQWGAYIYAKKVAEFQIEKDPEGGEKALILALLEEAARPGGLGYTGTAGYLEGYRRAFGKVYEWLAY